MYNLVDSKFLKLHKSEAYKTIINTEIIKLQTKMPLSCRCNFILKVVNEALAIQGRNRKNIIRVSNAFISPTYNDMFVQLSFNSLHMKIV